MSAIKTKMLALINGQQQVIGMHVSRGHYVEVTTADLIALCAENPVHPIAKVYMQACQDGIGSKRLVNSIDLQAVIEDRESSIVMHREGDRVIETKVLT